MASPTWLGVLAFSAFAIASLNAKRYKDGDLSLSDGPNTYEGNVLIYHSHQWGFVCDNSWDQREAEVVCRQLGHPGAIAAYGKSRYKPSQQRIMWLDNVNCVGDEKSLTDCGTDGWGRHNCKNTEAAGVKCLTPRDVMMLSDLPVDIKMASKELFYEISLENGTHADNGHLQLSIGGELGVICGDDWTIHEADVACRQLGKAYASQAYQYDFYGGRGKPVLLSGLRCTGDEKRLEQCHHGQIVANINCTSDRQVAGVSCTPNLPDLLPNHLMVQNTAHLEEQRMFFLKCALEENCVSRSAYHVAATDPGWLLQRRRLLRFSNSVLNNGTADFRPHDAKNQWDWHECHQHYHSMETFATYDIIDEVGNKVAEGHKASYCLEDSACLGNISKHYDCKNHGDQGISIGCMDNYLHDIDCQWLDVTDLKSGQYKLRVMVNPYKRVAELDYKNNVVLCDMYIDGSTLNVWDCHLTGLPSRAEIERTTNDEETLMV